MTTDFLLANLRALHRVAPDLVARIRLPVSDKHVQFPAAEGDPVLYQVGFHWQPLSIPPDQVDALVATHPGDGPFFVLGIGVGEIVHALLRRSPSTRVEAWDRDPWLLRQFLASRDLAREILGGRLRLHLAADVLALCPWKGPLVIHPLLGRVYRAERHFLEEGVAERRVLLAASGLFADDVADELRNRGYAVLPWETTRHAREELVLAARASGARFVVAVNYNHGLAEMCRELGLDLVCWEVDPAMDRITITEAGSTLSFGDDAGWMAPCARFHLFSHRAANVSSYQGVGFHLVEYLPLATNPERRFPVEVPEDSPYRVPVSFVGSSMLASATEACHQFVEAFLQWRPKAPSDLPEKVWEAVLQLQRAEMTRYRIPEGLDVSCPGWRAFASQQRNPDPAVFAGEGAAAEKRLNLVASLAPYGVQVWGDEGWQCVEAEGARYRGPAGHTHELNLIYSGSTINVDINRIYQPDIVTMRVFDVLACGGFLLTEWSPALKDLFEVGREVETWATQAELEEKIAYYLAHPEEARAIAERGRARVLRDHTVAQRVERMLGSLGG